MSADVLEVQHDVLAAGVQHVVEQNQTLEDMSPLGSTIVESLIKNFLTSASSPVYA